MENIRLKSRECKNQVRIHEFLTQARTGYLGLVDKESPYVIPLNFVWWKGSIYFHGAAEGKKATLITENNNACFTVSEEYGTMVDPVPANTDTAYMSVIISGKIEVVQNIEDATSIMQELLNKYVPGYYSSPLTKSHVEKYRSSLGSKTMVYNIQPTHISAKEHVLDASKQYVAGRTVKDDIRYL